MAARYAENWKEHAAPSEPYAGRMNDAGREKGAATEDPAPRQEPATKYSPARWVQFLSG